MRVFLDIGSHLGETVREVSKPAYAFDRIVCFEPSSVCVRELRKLAETDPRVEVCPFGLFDRDTEMELRNGGSLDASVLSDADGGPVETIRLVDAAKWFQENLRPDDFVVVKTNCEGSEVAILNRLIDENLLGRAVLVLVTFDIRAFPKLRHQEVALRRRLRESGLRNFCFSDDVMIGTTHEKRIAHWLQLFGIDQPQLGAEQVRERYRDNFERYSAKTGLRERLEESFKDRIRYSALPAPLKAALRSIKRLAGLHRERDVVARR